jgi:hypothetical protein
MTDNCDLARDFERSWLEAVAEVRQRLEQAQRKPENDRSEIPSVGAFKGEGA